MSVFDPDFTALPATLAIFPLESVLLLPRGELPLNIFEPRYVNMTLDAIAGDRMIGMVQPSRPGNDPGPPVYRTGCAGRIVAFRELDDGRLLITLKGLYRFDIQKELPLRRGYRRVTPDWSRYSADMDDPPAQAIDRGRLLRLLKSYFRVQDIQADWKTIEATAEDRLITYLAMACPFEGSEKQALLEAPTLVERSEVLMTLLEMAVHSAPAESSRQ